MTKLKQNWRTLAHRSHLRTSLHKDSEQLGERCAPYDRESMACAHRTVTPKRWKLQNRRSVQTSSAASSRLVPTHQQLR